MFIFDLIFCIISSSPHLLRRFCSHLKPCHPFFSLSPFTLPPPLLPSVLPPGYSPAWEVCSLLGQCEGYGELEARQELLAYSLTHCPPDSIHGLLAASSDLQTQVTFTMVLQNGFFINQYGFLPYMYVFSFYN